MYNVTSDGGSMYLERFLMIPEHLHNRINRMRFKKLSFLIHQVNDHIDIAYDGLIYGSGHSAYQSCIWGST